RTVAPHRPSGPPGAVEAGPLGPTGERMLAIWRAALGAPDIGPDDDFFAVGGHSILAVRMVAEVERAFGLRIRTARLFEAPTVRRFARLVEETREDASARPDCVVPIQAGGGRPPLVFLSGYGSAVIVFEALARAL